MSDEISDSRWVTRVSQNLFSPLRNLKKLMVECLFIRVRDRHTPIPSTKCPSLEPADHIRVAVTRTSELYMHGP